MLKRNLFIILSATLAVLFTVYIALDTFVITHVYENVYTEVHSGYEAQSASDDKNTVETVEGTSVEKTTSVDEENASDQTDTPVITDNSYSDSNISITITTYRENDTDIYVADVVVSDAEYLKTALAQNAYGKNVTDTTSNIAADNNAILAINGDYYGVQEKGYVIRNGVLYRNTAKNDQEDLVIYSDGSMAVIAEKDVTAETLLDAGAAQVLCFGPGLISDGEITVSTYDEVDKAMTSNPRTAIGVIDELHYVFVVADGRTEASEGLSLYELAEFMQGLGVQTAYNLDGGGSSTMVFNGKVINNPTTTGGHGGWSSGTSERSVSDIVYIGY